MQSTWVVLVGIDFYPRVPDKDDPRDHQNLQGCVADVMAVKEEYELEENRRPGTIHLTVLTATTPEDPAIRTLSEDASVWPTFDNVTGALWRVIREADEGDDFLFYYSGHGARDNSGNLALVLYEDAQPWNRHFRGEHLSQGLKKMVDRGLSVTAVLDCCFSGSLAREDDMAGAAVRSIAWDHAVEAASPGWATAVFRDATPEGHCQWLTKPEGYAILAACEPDQKAWEVDLGDRGRRGALSFMLMEVLGDLRTHGAASVHKSVHAHLRAKFRVKLPKQTPMRYGMGGCAVFGRLWLASGAAYTCVHRDSNRLYLDVGLAHGVQVGDEYTLSPAFFVASGLTEKSKNNVQTVTARVESVRSLTSDVVILDADSLQTPMTGWKATPILTSQLQAEVISSFARSDSMPEAAGVSVLVNHQDHYQLVDDFHQPMLGLPTIPTGEPDALKKVAALLEHISEYRHVENIRPTESCDAFDGIFSVKASVSRYGQASASKEDFEMRHGQRFSLEISNNSPKQPIYVAILNLTPSWGITNILRAGGRDDFIVLSSVPEGSKDPVTEKIGFKMTVPSWLQGARVQQCTDVIKVFVTSWATSFGSLELPKLMGGDHHSRGSNDDGVTEELARRLAEFASAKGSGVPEEAWSVKTFTVRTTRGP
ncbi:caspase domain-containing protein [Plectosphaerella plurivora]|uniref:Caspase domain-containing protein n=1 Tax=Plectosphaerella plurivora TaxID=936078 RepID=A0A9P8VCH4_9PEZI|nr:caspase domain-containing protein [Plectosphaerella plurivora]